MLPLLDYRFVCGISLMPTLFLSNSIFSSVEEREINLQYDNETENVDNKNPDLDNKNTNNKESVDENRKVNIVDRDDTSSLTGSGM